MIRLEDNLLFCGENFYFHDGFNKHDIVKNNVQPTVKIKTNDINSLALFITRSCNLKCPYCYEKDKKVEVMSDECFDKAIKIFGDQLRSIQLFGGEPFLFPQKIMRFVNKIIATNPSIIIMIVTNGVLIDNNIAKWLSAISNVRVIVSWDGLDDYDRYNGDIKKAQHVYNTIKLLNKLMPYRVSVRLTVNKPNVITLKKSLGFLYANKINYAIEPAFDYSSGDINDNVLKTLLTLISELGDEIKYMSEYRMISQQLHTKVKRMFRCGAGREVIRIDVNGDIYDCHRMMPRRENYLGNIYELSSPMDIQNASFFENSCDSIECCNKCEYRYLCGGCCVYSKSPKYCEIYKSKIKKVLHSIYYEEKANK